MSIKKRILLKLTGNIFLSDNNSAGSELIKNLVRQIKSLSTTHVFCIVIGGGNLFRGSVEGKQLGLNKSTGHHVGMLATVMNGLILQDLFRQADLKSSHLSAIIAPGVAASARQESIELALETGLPIIFSGGTGTPFFTTDTTAVTRALQINAQEVWKGTDVDGIYDKNPAENSDAQLIKKINYKDTLTKQINVMDQTAFALAAKHELVIRVFNIFEPDALKKAENDKLFGSTIS